MKEKQNMKFKNMLGIEHWKIVSFYLALYDSIAVSLSYLLALLLRFDFAFTRIPVLYLQAWECFVLPYALMCIVVFWRLKLYKSIWRFASFTELERITLASVITTIIHIIGSTITINILEIGTEYSADRMPFSYLIMGAIFQFVLVTVVRFSYRFILLLRASHSKGKMTRIVLVGNGVIFGTT